jgi:peptidoglycan/LPS O-acetylase OafA/YrhL
MKVKREYITDFVGLDLLRFILANVVVVRHYYHFYGPFKDSQFNTMGMGMTYEPFYKLLSPLYNFGQLAVPMFWLISGLIFYSVYHVEITKNQMSIGKFSFLRFTRLYPLHFVTLLLVAGLQTFYYFEYGSYFIYQENTLNRFILEIFFMDSWQVSGLAAFNIPAWSVSVEIFVYMVFYFVTSAGLTKGKGLPILLVFLLLINSFQILPPFKECLFFFFSGCMLARSINSGTRLTSLFIRALVAAVALVSATTFLRTYMPHTGLLNAYVIYHLRDLAVFVVVVLCFIITFRSATPKFVATAFRNLGNMTYSIYLVHFSIQICFFLVMQPKDYAVFNDPKILFLFLVTSIITGWLAFQYVEKPVQRYLRSKFKPPPSTEEIQQPTAGIVRDNGQLQPNPIHKDE